MIVYAHLRQATSGQRDAAAPERRDVQFEADTYEAGRDRISGELPEGWLVATWRVDR